MSNFHQGTLGFSSTDNALVNSSNPNNYDPLGAIASGGLNPSLDGLTADANVPLFNSSRTFWRSSSVSDTTAQAIAIDSLAASNSGNLSASNASPLQWAQQLGTSGYEYSSWEGTNAEGTDAWGFAKVNSLLLAADTEDNAGNTLSTARSITVDSTTSTFSDFVGTTDTNDYYRFTLYSRSTLNLLLNGLSANADLQLLDNNGIAIEKSSSSGTSAEAIARTLDAGTYYIRVYPNGSANTNYNLSVSAPPVLEWTRQLGTSGYEEAYAIAVDSAGNVYITGETSGNLGGTNAGSNDVWLAKYDNSGNQQWIRQFGTSQSDYSYGVAVDSAGNVYLTGDTLGNLGGTSAGSRDAWVAKYNSSGTQQWIRQLGTSQSDSSYGVAVDSAGNVYLTGGTSGNLGGTNAGNSDAWVAKYNSSGTQQWIRQLGTSQSDSSYGVAVDSAGNVYLTGDTLGNLGGTNAGSRDAWVAKYNSSGNQLWIRQFGTSQYDSTSGLAVDKFGNVYITGDTKGNLGGTYAGVDSDAYVAKFSSSGTQQWIQQFGTSLYDYPYGIAVDRFNNVYVAGGTDGSLGGTSAGNDNEDAWVFAKFSNDLGGNTLASAYNLGTLSGSRTYSNFIDAVGSNDYYQFSLSTTSNFNLLLTGLIADADIQLLDSSGVAVASSTNSGTNAESINTSLSAGTYYIHIYGYDPFDVDVNTTYALNLTVS